MKKYKIIDKEKTEVLRYDKKCDIETTKVLLHIIQESASIWEAVSLSYNYGVEKRP